MTEPKTAITPKRHENYSEWYHEVIKAADLAEHSPVRGCMVIKPWGYSLWENLQKELDFRFKETGHQNAYFPLFIPLSFLEKEAQHVEGFAKECAVVTHHRLEAGKDGKLKPAGPLEEPLIVRPTSETIIGEMFAKWVGSYRDLPLLINQWANVVRWEMRTRMFLRTTEFLWQEGHTAHATKEEAIIETMQMLGIYKEVIEGILAIPVIPGEKTENERFPGAESTYTLEVMTQDRKALQACTSHFLGQNFAKASGIQFRDEQGEVKTAWTTSWGATTRLIGALIMTHSDDDGLVLPPKIAPSHLVILPVIHKEETRESVLHFCHALAKELKMISYHGRPLSVIVDTRDIRGGDKTWGWIKKGIPLRLEIGPRDIAGNLFPLMRRDKPHKEMMRLSREDLLLQITSVLDAMQEGLFAKAKTFQQSHIKKIDTLAEFQAFFTPKNGGNPEIHGGFAACHFGGDFSLADRVQKEYGVTIRCIPLESPEEEGKCLWTGAPSHKRLIFAKAY